MLEKTVFSTVKERLSWGGWLGSREYGVNYSKEDDQAKEAIRRILANRESTWTLVRMLEGVQNYLEESYFNILMKEVGEMYKGIKLCSKL